MSIHPDLEWLAREVSEWNYGNLFANVMRWRIDEEPSLYWSSITEDDHKVNQYTYKQWQAARQQLGLDQQEVTPEEEEAWEAKERELIGAPRKAENFLMQAANLMAERGKQYDQPGGERSMSKAVAALNAITGRDLTEADGWLLMSLVKRVRQHSGAGYHKDSAEDAVAYAALEGEALEGGS